MPFAGSHLNGDRLYMFPPAAVLPDFSWHQEWGHQKYGEKEVIFVQQQGT